MLLENIDRRMNPGWLINSNCIMQSVADRADGRARKRRGRRVERRKKIMRNIPIRGHLCSTLFYSPCRSPPPPPPPFFSPQQTLYTSTTVSTGTAPLSQRGTFEAVPLFAQGLLEIRASDFSPFFFNAFPSLSLFPSFSPSPFPLSFLVVPAIVRRKSTRYWAR